LSSGAEQVFLRILAGVMDYSLTRDPELDRLMDEWVAVIAMAQQVEQVSDPVFSVRQP
jgi:hypothetical protein